MDIENGLPNGNQVSSFQVDGITCLDCARKFEKAVNALPGVTRASLNPITGKLTVIGVADLTAIRERGKEEEYIVNLVNEGTRCGEKQERTDWELCRAVLSGMMLAAGYGVEKYGIPFIYFYSLYVSAMVFGGWGNFRKAARSLTRGIFNMSVLMSVAVIGALLIGRYEEGASVAFLYAVSEMLEAWTMDKARRSIRQLMDFAPKTARIRRDGVESVLFVEEIIAGDVMIIRPGEKIAMDGIVQQGESSVNQSAITGESMPVEKGPGTEVYAGTINAQGTLEVKVTKLVKDSALARIVHMVEAAQNKRAPSQAFVEKFAAIYTPVVLLLAMGIVVLPPLVMGYEWTPWIYRGLALLVVACPCALVVSTPVAIVSAISNAAKHGVLIKGGLYLEAMGSLRAIAFDKTGTLTKGEPNVTEIMSFEGWRESEVLNMAADLETRSEHPLAGAIVRAAEAQGHAVSPVTDFVAVAGRGGQGTVNGRTVYIGSPLFFAEMGIDMEPVKQVVGRLQSNGRTTMIVGTRETVLGVIAVADLVREESADTLAELKQAGICHSIMLTGDNTETARIMARQVGIDEFRAELLPQDKVAVIQELLLEYEKVAMIGDGINDAPALALSTVGVAMGSVGTDTALETADIVLMSDDLTKLPFTIRLSRKALVIIRQNISFSVLIKVIAVLAVFPGWLSLWLAILADMGATLIVTLNSLRLLRENE